MIPDIPKETLNNDSLYSNTFYKVYCSDADGKIGNEIAWSYVT
jgi:hypothetical protein